MMPKLMYLKQFGLDRSRMRARLDLLQLCEADQDLGEQLQAQVLQFHAQSIIDLFYAQMQTYPDFMRILVRGYSLESLKRTLWQ